jgi:methylenetetrahydrofolate dehydrogenase (NADP+)/methenyltetrahydrofolate cyclohydrolase
MTNQKAAVLDGKRVAADIRARVTARAAAFERAHGRRPGLTAVLVGDDPASHVYVSSKEEAARESGLAGRALRLPGSTPHAELLRVVEALNADDTVDGILVQLPLPAQVEADAILRSIHPEKDVDGFHPENVGRLHLGLPAFAPCTPSGVMEALRFHDVAVEGCRAVVVGRSNIVGKPMAALLLKANATVTVCHSRTRDLAGTCREADVLVAAIGRPGLVTGAFVKPGAVVIDVGTNRLESPKDDDLAVRIFGAGSKRLSAYRERGRTLVGDVVYREAAEVAGLVTPVPGGVGPLTIAMLLSNTVDAAERREAGGR